MYNHQKGLPMFISLVGLVFVLFSFAVALGWLVEIINNYKQSQFSMLSENVPYAILWIFPYYIGRFVMGLFPSIYVFSDGIKINKGLGFTKTIRWNDIEGMVEYRNNTIALIVNCKGIPAFNGLYFNKLYSRFVGAINPVVFLSPSIERRGEIINQISDNSKMLLVTKRTKHL